MTNEIEIKIGRTSRKVKVASSWDDLELKTLLAFYNLLFSAPGDEFTVTSFTSVKLIGMLQHLLKIDVEFLAMWDYDRKSKNPDWGETEFLDELKQVLQYCLCGGNPTPEDGEAPTGLFQIEKENGEAYSALLNLTRNPWPILTGPGKSKRQAKRHYYAPADGLGNVTIYEMGMAFSYFEAYLKTNEIDHAYRLIALMYRPSRPNTRMESESGWGGDRRQKLRGYESKIDERVELVKTLPVLVQRVLVFWFAGCRQAIVNAYPKVFKRSGDGGKVGVDYGWGGVLLTVAENGPMGALGEVSDQHHGNVLTYLSMKADEAEEAARQAADAKRKRR